MKREELSDAFSDVSADLIEEAAPRKMRRRASRLLAPIAAVLVVAICLGLFFGKWNPFAGQVPADDPVSSEDEYQDPGHYGVQTLALANIPTSTVITRTTADSTLDGFLQKTTPQFLSEANDQNLAYSPLSLYFALAVAGECSAGETQRQILELLGETDAELLLSTAHDIWKQDYYRDSENVQKAIFADSLWFADDLSPDEGLLSSLSQELYLSAYSGRMGSEEFSAAFRDWMNEQTGGNLEGQISGLKFKQSTRFAIASTVDFYAKWAYISELFLTGSSVFHGTNGDTSCEYLNSVWRNDATYFWGERFTALSLAFEEQGHMLFILPDEGYTPADLLEDEAAIDLIVNGERTRRKGQSDEDSLGTFGFCETVAYFSIPKFDFTSNLDLSAGLSSLGVTDCFSMNNADFSPLLGDGKAAISKVDHTVRIAIDEEGVTASAYTFMGAELGLPETPPEEVCFIADRPFLFVITGRSGLPLFVGIVNQAGDAAPSQSGRELSLPEALEGVKVRLEGKPEYELNPIQCEAFLQFLRCSELEVIEGVDENKVVKRNSSILLTAANGEEMTLEFVNCLKDGAWISGYRVGDKCYGINGKRSMYGLFLEEFRLINDLNERRSS